jgi:hypothetical protein
MRSTARVSSRVPFVMISLYGVPNRCTASSRSGKSRVMNGSVRIERTRRFVRGKICSASES